MKQRNRPSNRSIERQARQKAARDARRLAEIERQRQQPRPPGKENT